LVLMTKSVEINSNTPHLQTTRILEMQRQR
jgi:hypothetical protein